MKRLAGICLTLSIGWIAAGCSSETSQEEAPAAPPPPAAAERAIAVLEPKSGSKLAGTATFTQQDGEVALEVTVRNVAAGAHAVHIHEVGDCSAADGSSAGGHWNPTGVAHGRWGEPPYHRGDIGNMIVGEDGTGSLTVTSSEWTIGGPPDSDILGHAIIVHSGQDDYTTQPTGAAGGRIGCGVIESEGPAVEEEM